LNCWREDCSIRGLTPIVFDIYQINATQPTTVYQSTVAETFNVNTGQFQSGGAQQSIVTNRSVFTAPEKIGSVVVNGGG